MGEGGKTTNPRNGNLSSTASWNRTAEACPSPVISEDQRGKKQSP